MLRRLNRIRWSSGTCKNGRVVWPGLRDTPVRIRDYCKKLRKAATLLRRKKKGKSSLKEVRGDEFEPHDLLSGREESKDDEIDRHHSNGAPRKSSRGSKTGSASFSSSKDGRYENHEFEESYFNLLEFCAERRSEATEHKKKYSSLMVEIWRKQQEAVPEDMYMIKFIWNLHEEGLKAYKRSMKLTREPYFLERALKGLLGKITIEARQMLTGTGYDDPFPSAAVEAAERYVPKGNARKSDEAHNGEDVPCGTCDICLVTEMDSENYHIVNEKCNHRFCTDCLRQHGKTMVKLGKSSVRCPQFRCTELWSSQLCDLLLAVSALDKLAQRRVENAIPVSERVYCAYKDCSALHLKPKLPSPNSPSGSRRTTVGAVECLSCHRLFCLECQVPWHSSLTCEEHKSLQEDEKSDVVFLRGLAKDRKWQRCSCGYVVERIEGCNHMKCRCGKEFCYPCGGKWSRAHLCKT